jgi:hypothetical protein
MKVGDIIQGFALPGWLALFVSSLMLAGLLATSRCWETWPPFRKRSGRKRFCQFITGTIPETITDVQGGFRGFFKGEIQVWFAFREQIERDLFIGKWSEISGPPLHLAGYRFRDRLGISQAYVTDKSEWLFVDSQKKIAVLYVPCWFTTDDLCP